MSKNRARMEKKKKKAIVKLFELNANENMCSRHANISKIRFLHRCFLMICGIFKNIFFIEHLQLQLLCTKNFKKQKVTLLNLLVLNALLFQDKILRFFIQLFKFDFCAVFDLD